MLGVAHTQESEWAAFSHPRTDGAGKHLLSREDRSKASLPSSRDRRHRSTGLQTNKEQQLVAVPDLGLGTLGTCPGPPQERASREVDIKKIRRLYVILYVIHCKLRYNYAFFY